ncbi:MAG: 2-C-methyl-D-erythritol 4-phosphate cytidylyltransferase [Anaerovoracaceae bacterium]|jgi:2-C-methyl-D-erythritol 4-phosphate cytidylyltransferase/2-C-methyl-D-erythritol 2,4-cyclodiphosphate synthase
MKTGVIIAAAGAGTRMGRGEPKQFMDIGGEPMLVRSARIFRDMPEICGMIVTSAEEYVARTEEVLRGAGIEAEVIAGGAERQDSVRLAVEYMAEEHPDWDCVLIHDCARPFVTEEIVRKCIPAASSAGAAVPVVPVKDTIRERGRTLDRSGLFAVQTPQGFRTDVIIEAHRRAAEDGFSGTDDISLAERIGTVPEMTEGSYKNIKITTPDDLEKISPGGKVPRTGTGFDVHRSGGGRRLVLGGAEFPGETGLIGHSDADVLLHAVMDALLGAAGLGDIGRHFPDTDERYAGISSMELLREVGTMLADGGFRTGNIDAVVICERPKIAPRTDEMEKNIAGALGIDEKNVNVKGTTTEGLGFTGRGEGIAASAVCTVYLTEGE